ncbi:MAG: recB [Chlamydiales bacterium]|jgi:exodeoxyribonuclease V beta subunit|nr:recB [Chlamydiales bacterium]
MFEVLDRSLKIHRNYFLEASAGTGKTFSIVHVVIRLILEENQDLEPIYLEQILLVTFTKAATRELKLRLHRLLCETLHVLKLSLKNEQISLGVPDYLQAILEKGEIAIKAAVRRIDNALINFDRAQIFTIHSFCYRMLLEYAFQANVGLQLIDKASDDNLIPLEALQHALKDYVRTGLQPTEFSHVQLRVIFSKYRYDIELLIKYLTKTLLRGEKIAHYPNFFQSWTQFCGVLRQLKTRYLIQTEKLLEDFRLYSTNYKKICNRQGEIFPLLLQEIEILGCIFEKNEWVYEDFERILSDHYSWNAVNFIHPHNLKARGNKPIDVQQLHYPHIFEILQKELYPLVELAKNPEYILARLAAGAQKHVQKVFMEEEILTPNDILDTMHRRLQTHIDFGELVRQRYKVAIVDEFQDTDLLQWEIFKELFLNHTQAKHYLYLVGDPKQSIYAFRRADIYIYLQALEVVGHSYRDTLDTNYRSHPELIKALNVCFCEQNAPGLISLPRLDSALPYILMNEPSFSKSYPPINDRRGFLHFFLAEFEIGRARNWPPAELEEGTLIPWIAKEIIQVNSYSPYRWKDFCILVKDRYQADKVQNYLRSQGIPAITRRSRNLADTPIFSAVRDLLAAMLDLRDLSAVKRSLGNLLIGWDYAKQHKLQQDIINTEEVWNTLYRLRNKLVKEGIAIWFDHLLQSQWHEDKSSLAEKLLEQSQGTEHYLHLTQMMEILIAYEKEQQASPQQLVAWLDELGEKDIDEAEQLKIKQLGEENAVNIMTLHMSKGLEFPIVFALGLINRTAQREELVPLQQEGEAALVVCDQDDQRYQDYCQEIDAEKIRQLYVAMTRAKHRLYAPILVGLSDKEPKELAKGTASPMELFLSTLGKAFTGYYEKYERIIRMNRVDILETLQSLNQNNCITYELVENNAQLVELATNIEGWCSLEPPKKPVLNFQKQLIHSYTSLPLSHGEGVEKLNSKVLGICDLEPGPSMHTLPKGLETGIIIHELLQKFPYTEICQQESMVLITENVKKILDNTTLAGWEGPVSDMMYAVLNVPLKTKQGIFKLKDIDFCNSYHEMEFLFPWHSGEKIEDIELLPGFMTGFIDFIFSYKGIFYFIDWKTNWLGDSKEAYKIPNLQIAMAEYRYDLQAAIYTEALKKYLKLIDSRPFEECFGGSFYFFLRGLSSESEQNTGVYHFYPQMIESIRG